MEIEKADALHRLTPEEFLLVQNYRRCKACRQDVLLYFSDELVKQEPAPIVQGNVFLLTGRK